MAFRTNKVPVLQSKSASGAVATFNTALAMPLKSCTSLISGYQEGSGTPSPENKRPLHAFSSASLYVSGKNIIDINDAHITSQTFSSIVFLKAGTYTLSANYNNVSNIIGYLRLNTRYDPVTQLVSITFTPNDSGRSSASFTLENDSICYFAFQGASSGYDFYVSNIMLEVGGSESSFEPYNGNTYTFTFGQSIYQGSIDWKRGVVTTSMGVRVFDGSSDENWRTYSGQRYTVSVSDFTSPSSSQLANIMCDKLETITKAQQGSRTLVISGSDGGSHDFMVNVGANSYEDMIDWLNANPITVAYELATPIEIQLGGVNILTQQGVNNIFADCGDIDLTFKDLDIAKRGNFREVFRLPS